MVKYKDYYAILGVSREASEKEIKASYRKLARQHHPDANKGDQKSEEKFKELGEAYEVLKDPEKRKRYDMLGSNWKAGADFQPPPGQGGFDFSQMGDMGGASAFSDFFEAIFGQAFQQQGGGFEQGSPFGGGRSRGQFKAQDQEAEIELSVEELANGSERTIRISGPSGSKTLDVKIPKGVRAGSRVRVAGEGGDAGPGVKRGDLFLKVKLKPHPLYVVEGDNLITELKISPAKAVLGGEAIVTTIDGPVKIKIPPGSQSGRTLRLKGKGLPRLKQDTRGDQMVRLTIAIAADISNEEKELYEKLAKIEEAKSKTKTGV